MDYTNAQRRMADATSMDDDTVLPAAEHFKHKEEPSMAAEGKSAESKRDVWQAAREDRMNARVKVKRRRNEGEAKTVEQRKVVRRRVVERVNGRVKHSRLWREECIVGGVCDAGWVHVPFAGRIAQSVEHSANNAAVQGSSPCMTIMPLFLLSCTDVMLRWTQVAYHGAAVLAEPLEVDWDRLGQTEAPH